LDVLNAAYRVTSAGLTCEVRTTERQPLRLIGTRNTGNGVLTALRADESIAYTLGGGGLCGFATGSVAGSGTIVGAFNEATRTNFEFAVWQVGQAFGLRNEAGTLPLTPRTWTAGNDATLRLRAAAVTNLIITAIAPVDGNTNRFRISYGGANACQDIAGT